MSDKKAPRKEDGMDLYMRALGSNSSGDAIRSQIAAGQRSFVNSDTLPREMSQEDRATLEAAGVVFGEVVPDDDLFQYVHLPQGWHKSSTGRSMHNSALLDDKGRKRASIFYKAAFYDRRANLHCNQRFGVRVDNEQLDQGIAEAVVSDSGTEIFRSAGVEFDPEGDYRVSSEAQDKATAEAKAWLAERYPEWKNVSAYWD